MNDDVRAAIAERMNRLDEIGVLWDRCVLRDGDGTAFGWIARDDGRFDFVVLSLSWGVTSRLDDLPLEWLAVGFSTSSAEHSAQISRLLFGASGNHKDCERVEDVFAGLVHNYARLA